MVTMRRSTFVIVGAGRAGARAAKALRTNGLPLGRAALAFLQAGILFTAID